MRILLVQSTQWVECYSDDSTYDRSDVDGSLVVSPSRGALDHSWEEKEDDSLDHRNPTNDSDDNAPVLSPDIVVEDDGSTTNKFNRTDKIRKRRIFCNILRDLSVPFWIDEQRDSDGSKYWKE